MWAIWLLFSLLSIDQQVRVEGFQEVQLHLKIGAFRVHFLPTEGSQLTLQGTYWPELIDTPRVEVEPEGEEVLRVVIELGTQKKRTLKWRSGVLDSNQVIIRVPREVTYTLALELGAVDAEIDVGGIPVKNLDFEGGAARALLRFSAPNPWIGGACEIDVGAAKLVLEQLGNGNFKTIEVNGGVAAQDLDLRGSWRVPATLKINAGMSKFEIKVPRDVGIRVRYRGFLSYPNWEHFEKVGDFYQTENYGSTEKNVDLLLEGAFSLIDFDFLE